MHEPHRVKAPQLDSPGQDRESLPGNPSKDEQGQLLAISAIERLGVEREEMLTAC